MDEIESGMNTLALFAVISGVIQIILIVKFLKLCETVKNMYIYIAAIEGILDERLKNNETLPAIPSVSKEREALRKEADATCAPRTVRPQ